MLARCGSTASEAPEAAAPRRRYWRLAGLTAGAAASLALLCLLLAAADLSEVLSRIASKPGLWLATLPGFLALGLDTLGWKLLLDRLGAALSFRALLRVRLAAESVALSLPSGHLLADAASGWVLRRRGLAWRSILASLAGRRYLFALSHALILTLGTLAAFGSLRAASAGILGRPGLEWAACLLAVGFLSLTLLVPTALRPLRETQSVMQIPVGAMFLLSLLAESLEAYVALRLLGAGLSFADALAIESLLGLLRAVAFFVPAGLGVQDVGYVLMLRAFGVGEALSLGSAFALLRRSREAVTALVGYLLLGASGAGGTLPRGEASDALG